MLKDDEVARGAQILHSAFEAHRQVPPLSVTFPDADIEDAYRIQQRFVDQRVSEGRRVRGYKVGLTSKVMQALTDHDEPDFSALLDDFFLPEASSLAMSRFLDPRIEIELAFVMKDSLRGPGINTADVIRATDFILPAIEIVDFRVAQEGRRKGSTIFDTVADLASCGAVILGGNPIDLRQINIAQVRGTCMRNGEPAESGMALQVMGNPINAIAWLANKLGALGGITFEPGHTILSGSFIRVVRVSAGDHFVASFDQGLGDVELWFR